MGGREGGWERGIGNVVQNNFQVFINIEKQNGGFSILFGEGRWHQADVGNIWDVGVLQME